ncbi:semaphorin-5B-like [Mizuhopecten yessoensis]|uniref:semaphorin-5B-like n=1 Tax=Mizuhopecten yessoensis TaxID=6573 RepID=UPI000B45749F|nr:semaphorin-5B-like [Mizuhopecten yessoensis]
MPCPTAPVAGKLATGSCLTPSDFTRSGRWLQITRDQEPSGYLFETDVLQTKPCSGYHSRRADSHCPSHCQSDCCGDGQSLHHHGLSCYSCAEHCCNHNPDDGPEWSNWSHCSGSCGQGTRSRTCTNRCHSLHSNTQTETCHHLVSCPVWTTFSECSVTCGGGTQSRHCTYHCYGLHSHSETKACHRPACEPVVNPVSDHVCDKVSVVQAVALQVAENCSGQGHLPFTPFVIQHCRAPASVADWVAGYKVSTSCNTLAMYSPVATFYNSGHHDIMTGVFVGCATNDEFKVITSSCGVSPQVMHISSKNGTFNHFYQVKW